MKFVRPRHLIPIVNHNEDRQSDKFREKIGTYESYMVGLSFLKQRGLEWFKMQYLRKREEGDNYEEKERDYQVNGGDNIQNHRNY